MPQPVDREIKGLTGWSGFTKHTYFTRVQENTARFTENVLQTDVNNKIVCHNGDRIHTEQWAKRGFASWTMPQSEQFLSSLSGTVPVFHSMSLKKALEQGISLLDFHHSHQAYSTKSIAKFHPNSCIARFYFFSPIKAMTKSSRSPPKNSFTSLDSEVLYVFLYASLAAASLLLSQYSVVMR